MKLHVAKTEQCHLSTKCFGFARTLKQVFSGFKFLYTYPFYLCIVSFVKSFRSHDITLIIVHIIFCIGIENV